ncbi:MAG: radical SAM protein, partial [Polyangiaceae bacterium]
ARPGHEYLSMGAGTDFDRKIVVKPRAAALLREAFEKKSWKGELILFSGVTDCYQPLEASLGLTRGCLEVCAEYKNPVGIITKSPLIERDLDLLAELASRTRLNVVLSIPFWDPEKARAVEPFVATPQRRMHTVERLAARGIRVGVNVAPVIPGLGDEEIGDVLKAAKEAGATDAAMVMLRLPGPVKEIFEQRIREALPLRAEKILNRVRDVRGGKMNDPRFGTRMKGEGVYADAITALFKQTAEKLGLNTERWDPPDPEHSSFERPSILKERGGDGQLALFR